MKIVEKLIRDRPGRPTKYYWSNWADGDVRELDTQKEFGVKPGTFKGLMHKWARENNREAKFAIVSGNVVQFLIAKKK